MELWIFIVAIYLIYILFFSKEEKLSPRALYTSAPVKAPPKEWLANNKKKISL